MLKSLSLAVSLLLASPLCNAEVFKCVKDGGRIVYQNFPCPIDSIGSEAIQRPSVPAVAPTPRLPIDADKTAAVDREVSFLMGPDEVLAIWGKPLAVISTGQDRGLVQIWQYEGDRTVGFNSKGLVANMAPFAYQDKD